MEKESKIYIAGHLGMVGSAITRNLKSKGFNNIIGKSISELDLINQHSVQAFFESEKPDYVILAAAKVGGIVANNTYRAEFIYQNLQIQNNIIHNAYLSKVKKLLFLGSSCIYPKNAPQPLKEDYLLTSELEYTNEPYAIAKIAGIKLCESYNIQYGTNFISVMPTNLYGSNDNYNLEKSHVLPALIRKMHLGKCIEESNWDAILSDIDRNPIETITKTSNKEDIIKCLENFGIKTTTASHKVSVEIALWGSGTPRREFLHADDMADACVFIMQNLDFKDIKGDANEIKNTHINIGCGEDLSIEELALMIKEIVGFKGNISWDKTKADGTMQKLLDVTKLHQLNWKHKINLTDGIKEVYMNYIEV
jgi:GDP-L-fucose synthase